MNTEVENSKHQKYSKINEKIFKYYSFDIDDNLLYTNTKIIMEHLVNNKWIDEEVDTAIFSKIRGTEGWRYKPGDESFSNFRDYGHLKDETFIIDFKYAVINKKFGPSWTKFLECLINGNIFSIITSRGHSPKNIRKALYWLIYEYGLDNFKDLQIKNINKNINFKDQMIKNLLKYHKIFKTESHQVIDYYIELCPIYTISSNYFIEKYGIMTAEESKKIALQDFNEIVNKYATKLGINVKYGFSDDDPKFVKAAMDQFLELKLSTKNVTYSVFDTGGDKKIKKVL